MQELDKSYEQYSSLKNRKREKFWFEKIVETCLAMSN